MFSKNIIRKSHLPLCQWSQKCHKMWTTLTKKLVIFLSSVAQFIIKFVLGNNSIFVE